MGPVVVNPGSAYARVVWSTNPSRTSQEENLDDFVLVFDSMPPMFAYDNLSI